MVSTRKHQWTPSNSYRLTTLFDVAPESEPALLPTFLLQPLVENAIVHGLRELKGNGVISIRSAIDSNGLVIAVLDNGTGLSVRDATRMEFGLGLTHQHQANCGRASAPEWHLRSGALGGLRITSGRHISKTFKT